MNEKKVILIADDEPIGRQLLEAILISENFELHFAKDGKEAIEKVENLIPDLILLDVMMPFIDGFEVCKYIKGNNKLKNIPVFLITALDDRDSKLKGLELGANDYISKPFDKNEILAKIKNYFNLQQNNENIYKVENLTDFLNQIPELRNINNNYLKYITTKNSFINISSNNNFIVNIFKKNNKILFYFFEYKEKSIQTFYNDLLLENYFTRKDISSINDLLNNGTIRSLTNCLIFLANSDSKKCEILNLKYSAIQITNNKVILHEPIKNLIEITINSNDIFIFGTYNIIEFFNLTYFKDNIKNFTNSSTEDQQQNIEKWIQSYKQCSDEDVLFTKICI